MPKVLKESELPGLDHLPEDKKSHRWYLFCPGCHEAAKQRHPDDESLWISHALHCFDDRIHSFNGDLDAPTLSPSLLSEWTDAQDMRYCCHSYVNGGVIQFLGDCTHPLVGQTVPLLDAQAYLNLVQKRTGGAS